MQVRPQHDRGAHGGIGGQGARHFQQTCVGFEASRQALHLTVGITLAAPHVVVDGGGSGHDTHHTGFGGEPAGTARANECIGAMCRDERGGRKRSIDFPNAAHG